MAQKYHFFRPNTAGFLKVSSTFERQIRKVQNDFDTWIAELMTIEQLMELSTTFLSTTLHCCSSSPSTHSSLTKTSLLATLLLWRCRLALLESFQWIGFEFSDSTDKVSHDGIVWTKVVMQKLQKKPKSMSLYFHNRLQSRKICFTIGLDCARILWLQQRHALN